MNASSLIRSVQSPKTDVAAVSSDNARLPTSSSMHDAGELGERTTSKTSQPDVCGSIDERPRPTSGASPRHALPSRSTSKATAASMAFDDSIAEERAGANGTMAQVTAFGMEVELDDLPDYPLMSSMSMAREESAPVSRQASRQGAASPSLGNNMGRMSSRRSNPASSAAPQKKAMTMNEIDSGVRMPSRESPRSAQGGSPKSRATTMSMDDGKRNSEVEQPAASGRPPSRSVAQSPSKKKATTSCDLSVGDDQVQRPVQAELPAGSGRSSSRSAYIPPLELLFNFCLYKTQEDIKDTISIKVLKGSIGAAQTPSKKKAATVLGVPGGDLLSQ